MVQRRFYKTYTIILILLSLVSVVSSAEHTLETIEKCVGVVNVLDESQDKTGYSLKNCTTTQIGWLCPCKEEPFPIVLEYEEGRRYDLNLILTHYISAEQTELNKRMKSLEGLILDKAKTKQKVEMPKIEVGTGTTIIVIVIIILVALVGISILVVKWVLKDKDDDYGFIIKPNNDNNNDEEPDEEAQRILNRYT